MPEPPHSSRQGYPASKHVALSAEDRLRDILAARDAADARRVVEQFIESERRGIGTQTAPDRLSRLLAALRSVSDPTSNGSPFDRLESLIGDVGLFPVTMLEFYPRGNVPPAPNARPYEEEFDVEEIFNANQTGEEAGMAIGFSTGDVDRGVFTMAASCNNGVAGEKTALLVRFETEQPSEDYVSCDALMDYRYAFAAERNPNFQHGFLPSRLPMPEMDLYLTQYPLLTVSPPTDPPFAAKGTSGWSLPWKWIGLYPDGIRRDIVDRYAWDAHTGTMLQGGDLAVPVKFQVA